jgi:DNA-binding beta-propeller fold protein YncE
VLPDGKIVVADFFNHRIRVVDPSTGVVTTLAGSGFGSFVNGTGTAANFNYPFGVAVIPSTGVIVVADQANNRIRLVTYPGGVVTTLAGSGTATFADGTGAGASFSAPRGVAVTSSGNIVVSDQSNNRIRLVTYPGGVVTTLAGSGTGTFADGTGTAASFYQPQTVAVIPSSDIVVVADQLNHRIRLVTPAGVVTTLAGSGTGTFADGTGAAASFSQPSGVAIDPFTDRVYVADMNNNRIRQVTLPYS